MTAKITENMVAAFDREHETDLLLDLFTFMQRDLQYKRYKKWFYNQYRGKNNLPPH